MVLLNVKLILRHMKLALPLVKLHGFTVHKVGLIYRSCYCDDLIIYILHSFFLGVYHVSVKFQFVFRPSWRVTGVPQAICYPRVTN